jgi:hypothetical protein
MINQTAPSTTLIMMSGFWEERNCKSVMLTIVELVPLGQSRGKHDN